MSFNTLVLQIATIILIICLVMIGWGIYNSVNGKNANFPPVIADCPDFWTMTSELNSENKKVTYCNNNLKMGKGAAISGNPKCNSFQSEEVSTNCEKLALSNICDITWDGITGNSVVRNNCNNNNNNN